MTTSSFVGDHNQLLKTQTKDGPGSTEPQAATSKELVQLPEPAAFAVQGFKLYAILVGVCFGAFMMSLDVFILSTAIPSITSEFHDTSQLSWYPAAYTLTTCVLTPLTGKLTAEFPLRWVYICFFSIFLVGSAVCGWAPNSDSFIAGRAIAGVGASGVATGGMTVVLVVASAKTKPLFMGICSSCFALGVILAPILSGLFSEKATWRWCFWVNLPPGAITLATMLFFFKPLPSEGIRKSIADRIWNLDLLGCAIFIPGTFMSLLALTWGGTKESWDSATIIGLFVGGGVTLIIFVIWERYKGEGAMIPGILLQRRTITFSVLFSFCHMGSIAITGYYLPEWFQAVQGVSPLESGTRTLASALSQIFGTLFAGALALKVKFYNPWLFLGPIFMCTAAALYSQFSTFGTPASHYIGFQVIQGLGVGMAQQMPSLLVQLALSDREDLLPVGISLNLFAQYLGATFTQVIGGVIFHSVLNRELTNHADLEDLQIAQLSAAGTANIRQVVEQYFPDSLHLVLESYNTAITSVFFIPVSTTAIAFCLAFGVKWIMIQAPSKTGSLPAQEQQGREQEVELEQQQPR